MGRYAHGLFEVPEEYGGLGAGYVAYVLAVEELVQASMSVGVLVSVQGLAQEAILRFGTEEQNRLSETVGARGKNRVFRLY